MTKEEREINLTISLIPIIFLIIALFITIKVFNLQPHIPLLCATAVAAFIATLHRFSWKEVQEGMLKGISLSMGAILVLLIMGTMMSAWMLAGIIPSMIFYGLKILSPGIFLIASLVICSIISFSTGSSWTTVATVGLALVAVGKGLGISSFMVAGAIISGSYLGDKISSLSDTTKLASAVAGIDIKTHIRHMLYTTAPSYIISILLFGFLDYKYSANNFDSQSIETILSTLKAHFFIHPVLLLAPTLVIILVAIRIPLLPALLSGTFLGGIFALISQSSTMGRVFEVCQSGYTGTTGTQIVDELLKGKGLFGTLETVALIICALSFGGIMQGTGMLNSIAKALLKRIKRTGPLVASTVINSLVMNITASNQSGAIVAHGKIYKNAYQNKGLHPKNFSRALEDSATLTSPLIPWNTCGAFIHQALGIHPLAYLPYAFLNLLTPVISIFYGYTGITMEKVKDNEPDVNE